MVLRKADGDKNTEVKIEALVVPFICSPIRGQQIELTQKEYHHLQGIELADHSEVNFDCDIQLLVGANMMWQ